MEPTVETTVYPSTSDVLRALADKLDGQAGSLERLQVMQATPYQYVARLHPVGGVDFEGYFVDVPLPGTAG